MSESVDESASDNDKSEMFFWLNTRAIKLRVHPWKIEYLGMERDPDDPDVVHMKFSIPSDWVPYEIIKEPEWTKPKLTT